MVLATNAELDRLIVRACEATDIEEYQIRKLESLQHGVNRLGGERLLAMNDLVSALNIQPNTDGKPHVIVYKGQVLEVYFGTRGGVGTWLLRPLTVTVVE